MAQDQLVSPSSVRIRQGALFYLCLLGDDGNVTAKDAPDAIEIVESVSQPTVSNIAKIDVNVTATLGTGRDRESTYYIYQANDAASILGNTVEMNAITMAYNESENQLIHVKKASIPTNIIAYGGSRPLLMWRGITITNSSALMSAIKTVLDSVLIGVKLFSVPKYHKYIYESRRVYLMYNISTASQDSVLTTSMLGDNYIRVDTTVDEQGVITSVNSCRMKESYAAIGFKSLIGNTSMDNQSFVIQSIYLMNVTTNSTNVTPSSSYSRFPVTPIDELTTIAE